MKLIPETDAQPPNAQKLREYFSRQEKSILAYSVESASPRWPLSLTSHYVGSKMLGVIPDISSLAPQEYRSAIEFARNHELPLQIVWTDEMTNLFCWTAQVNHDSCCNQAFFGKTGRPAQIVRRYIGGAARPLFCPAAKES